MSLHCLKVSKGIPSCSQHIQALCSGLQAPGAWGLFLFVSPLSAHITHPLAYSVPLPLSSVLSYPLWPEFSLLWSWHAWYLLFLQLSAWGSPPQRGLPWPSNSKIAGRHDCIHFFKLSAERDIYIRFFCLVLLFLISLYMRNFSY